MGCLAMTVRMPGFLSGEIKKPRDGSIDPTPRSVGYRMSHASRSVRPTVSPADYSGT